MTNLKSHLIATLCALWTLWTLSACTPLPPPASAPATAPAAKAPAAAPSAPRPVTPAAPDAGPLLRIDSAQSLIVATVRRGGILARLGHDHVVASHAISGTVSPSRNRADFTFRLDQMNIDEADLRRAAGLEKQPSADAIEGTRHNMLTKVLDADRYPVVTVHAERLAAGQPLQVGITLHGVTRTLAIPVALREANGVINVQGTVNLKQTDFGLTPFSVMGGAMSVQDQMELRFDLTAR
ncbi:polyisoprenoid-binding protein YceI [Duganella sp. 1224]|uniref:YceI family protein n=1 Tax=Duganella sp. 1224 TaxID=2587052 RepID=UPI0015C772AE|nr:YceI family protein [Duganella sp. 1224]NYE59697.1 polyisoprenoid-binding protein YceI [Duganella sp. 1224]